MTLAEQFRLKQTGLAMIAHSEGKPVQSSMAGRDEWEDTAIPLWDSDFNYRANPGLGSMNTEHKFKIGDWVFCDLALHQITEMNGDAITGVTDGFFNKGSSSWNDQAFPLDLGIKTISANFEGQKDKLHREGSRQLNFPDMHRWLVNKWVAACRAKDDPEAVSAAIRELDQWAASILNRCEELNREQVGGIRLFR